MNRGSDKQKKRFSIKITSPDHYEHVKKHLEGHEKTVSFRKTSNDYAIWVVNEVGMDHVLVKLKEEGHITGFCYDVKLSMF